MPQAQAKIDARVQAMHTPKFYALAHFQQQQIAFISTIFAKHKSIKYYMGMTEL